MSGGHQAVFMNQRSFGEPPPTVIGQAYGGGYYVGKITQDDGIYYLVVAPKSTEAFKKWKTTQSVTSGASSLYDGIANSNNLTSSVYQAAKYCNDLSEGGYTDWYLPAPYELSIAYRNLKPTTVTNDTTVGYNNKSVPTVSNYTTYNPARTSVANFQEAGGSEYFQGTDDSTYNWYWTSRYRNSSTAYAIRFRNGSLGDGIRKMDGYYNVRAFRRVPV